MFNLHFNLNFVKQKKKIMIYPYFILLIFRYNHLAELLEKILSERPNNAVDVFEEYSKKLKDQRHKEKSNNYRDYFIPIDDYNEAEKLIQLFRVFIHSFYFPFSFDFTKLAWLSPY